MTLLSYECKCLHGLGSLYAVCFKVNPVEKLCVSVCVCVSNKIPWLSLWLLLGGVFTGCVLGFLAVNRVCFSNITSTANNC